MQPMLNDQDGGYFHAFLHINDADTSHVAGVVVK